MGVRCHVVSASALIRIPARNFNPCWLVTQDLAHRSTFLTILRVDLGAASDVEILRPPAAKDPVWELGVGWRAPPRSARGVLLLAPDALVLALPKFFRV